METTALQFDQFDDVVVTQTGLLLHFELLYAEFSVFCGTTITNRILST